MGRVAECESRASLLIIWVQAGECVDLNRDVLSYSEPVLMLGYYHQAPSFLHFDKSIMHALLTRRTVFPEGEGPECISLDPHIDQSEIEIVAMSKQTRYLKPRKPIFAGSLRHILS